VTNTKRTKTKHRKVKCLQAVWLGLPKIALFFEKTKPEGAHGPPECFFYSCQKLQTMEQQLINALMKLFAKAGGGSLIKDLIQQVDQDGNPKVWTAAEVESAIDFINWQTENFSASEARAIIESLEKKYNLSSGNVSRDRTSPSSESLPEVPGVHGLR
jgi:hypothetical protein